MPALTFQNETKRPPPYGSQIVAKFNNKYSYQNQQLALIPYSTNVSHGQHFLPVNFNNFIFNSTISSQHQLRQLLNFNIVISLKINGKNQFKHSLFAAGSTLAHAQILTT